MGHGCAKGEVATVDSSSRARARWVTAAPEDGTGCRGQAESVSCVREWIKGRKKERKK